MSPDVRSTRQSSLANVGLCLPVVQLDTDRSTYGMKEKTLADAFVAALQVAPTSETVRIVASLKLITHLIS